MNIELTNIYPEYNNWFVNTKKISHMTRIINTEAENFTLIIMDSGNDIEVKETPEEILKLIKGKPTVRHKVCKL